MAFNTASLGALIQGNGFTLWHYRTTDSRAVCTAAGYFASRAGSLRPGDLMVLHTADALALVPIRSGPALGTGVTLDGVVGPLNTVRSIAQSFSLSQAAAAVVRGIILAPLAASIAVGTSIPVSATVLGPVSQIAFTLRDADGAVVPPVLTATVSGGVAIATFAPQPVGSSYRVEAQDVGDARVIALSGRFNIGADLRLMLGEGDFHLLQESGAGLKR